MLSPVLTLVTRSFALLIYLNLLYISRRLL